MAPSKVAEETGVSGADGVSEGDDAAGPVVDTTAVGPRVEGEG